MTKGVIRMSDLERTLCIWKRIDIPANPKRNDVRRSFVSRCVLVKCAMDEIPYVISKSPLKYAGITLGSKLKRAIIGVHMIVAN